MGRRRQCADGRKGINHVAGQSRQLVGNPKIIPSGHAMFFFFFSKFRQPGQTELYIEIVVSFQITLLGTCFFTH